MRLFLQVVDINANQKVQTKSEAVNAAIRERYQSDADVFVCDNENIKSDKCGRGGDNINQLTSQGK